MAKKRVTKTSGLTEADVAGLVEIRENNAEVIQTGISTALARALEKIGLVAEGYAKRECPVDTGRLRNSITHALGAGGLTVYIGTNVEYGPYVELGTSDREAHPFLRPAARDHSAQYRRILKSEMGG